MFTVCKIFSFLFFATSNTSDSLPAKITSSLENWSKKNPIEKTFLHTDKSTYLAGENIWYKSYITLDGEPTFLSKIIYIDLVDEKGKVIDKQMKAITNGTTSGDFIVPKNIPSGNYSINAYTLWMLNDQSYIFRKNISIYNNDYKPADKKPNSNEILVNFFPEGGELIEGLKSTVAFYATNKMGHPVEVKGTVINQSGKQIATISSVKTGYGKFEITPVPNDKLTALIKINDVQKTYKLPEVKKNGIVLSVNNLNANRTFVQVSRQVTEPSIYNNLTVFAQMDGKPLFMGQINFNEDATAMAIPKKNLPAGIMHITVFDKNLIPLAERLVFISNYELPAISITTDSLSFLARGKNKLKFDFSKFSTPNVSIAITDAETTALPHTENNILSNLLLTSDLKGHIYQPGYYFQNKEAATLEQLDLLMLTHGWRRFRWDNVFNNKDIALKYPVESGISVSGIVTIPESKKTIAGGHVDILTKGEDSSTILSKALVNANGEFMIDDLNFKQMATVYLQGSKSSNKNANVDIILNKSYIDTLRFSENKPQIDLDTFSSVNQMNNKLFAVIAEEKERNKVVTLSEVKVTAKKISRIDSLNTNYASDLFRSGQSLEITSQHYLSIWQFLRDQVNGLVVEGDIMNPSVYFRRFAGMNLPSIADEESANQSGGIEVNGITYFLNEINVSKDVISALQPSDIALVKVFKGPEGAVLGVNEGGIAIYTKKGQTGTKRPAEKGFFTERKIGYAVSREFFNPDYSVTWDSSFKDNRTTLYWNPNIRTDKNGNATIRFFNNDITKKYKITIQGIDKKGDILFIDKVLQ